MAVTMEVIERCKREILEGLDELIRIAEESPREYYHIADGGFLESVHHMSYSLGERLYIARHQVQEENK